MLHPENLLWSDHSEAWQTLVQVQERIMRVGRAESEQDLYALLGVPSGATREEIRRAHRHLVVIYHPDRCRGDKSLAEARMKKINVAATILLDPASRGRYDALRSAASVAAPPARAPTPASQPVPSETTGGPFTSAQAASWSPPAWTPPPVWSPTAQRSSFPFGTLFGAIASVVFGLCLAATSGSGGSRYTRYTPPVPTYTYRPMPVFTAPTYTPPIYYTPPVIPKEPYYDRLPYSSFSGQSRWAATPGFASSQDALVREYRSLYSSEGAGATTPSAPSGISSRPASTQNAEPPGFRMPNAAAVQCSR